jgi:hypothetical protein
MRRCRARSSARLRAKRAAKRGPTRKRQFSPFLQRLTRRDLPLTERNFALCNHLCRCVRDVIEIIGFIPYLVRISQSYPQQAPYRVVHHAAILPYRWPDPRRPRFCGQTHSDCGADRGYGGLSHDASSWRRSKRKAVTDMEVRPPEQLSQPTRRQFLASAAALGGGLSLSISVKPAAATPESMRTAIRNVVGEASVCKGKVRLELPALVESGNAVPVTVAVDSPMTASDYVKAAADRPQVRARPQARHAGQARRVSPDRKSKHGPTWPPPRARVDIVRNCQKPMHRNHGTICSCH